MNFNQNFNKSDEIENLAKFCCKKTLSQEKKILMQKRAAETQSQARVGKFQSKISTAEKSSDHKNHEKAQDEELKKVDPKNRDKTDPEGQETNWSNVVTKTRKETPENCRYKLKNAPSYMEEGMSTFSDVSTNSNASSCFNDSNSSLKNSFTKIKHKLTGQKNKIIQLIKSPTSPRDLVEKTSKLQNLHLNSKEIATRKSKSKNQPLNLCNFSSLTIDNSTSHSISFEKISPHSNNNTSTHMTHTTNHQISNHLSSSKSNYKSETYSHYLTENSNTFTKVQQINDINKIISQEVDRHNTNQHKFGNHQTSSRENFKNKFSNSSYLMDSRSGSGAVSQGSFGGSGNGNGKFVSRSNSRADNDSNWRISNSKSLTHDHVFECLGEKPTSDSGEVVSYRGRKGIFRNFLIKSLKIRKTQPLLYQPQTSQLLI